MIATHGYMSTHPLMSLLYEPMRHEKTCAKPDQPSKTNPFPVDLVETSSHYIIYADLPGSRKEHIELNFEEGEHLLQITAKHVRNDEADEKSGEKYLHRERAELRAINLQRHVELPRDAVAENAEASLLDGVLTIRIPRQQPKRHQIALN